MFVEPNEDFAGEGNNEARLTSIKMEYDEPKCLSFYHLMADAPGSNKLMVSLKTDTSEYPIWFKQIDTGRKVMNLLKSKEIDFKLKFLLFF